MKSMRKGFTLIELMIVIAIIAIIAAIAIPNLMQSRIRANEATAVSTIKQYATAQVTFQVGKQGRGTATTGAGTAQDPTVTAGIATNTGASGFCDNFRNLYYAPPVGQTAPSALISQAVADAYGVDTTITGAAATYTTRGDVGGRAAYQGYYVNEPQDLTSTFYVHNFAILATPAHSTNTGTNQYWVDQQGTVYMKGLSGGATYDSLVGEGTPSQEPAADGTGGENDYTGWDVL